MPYWPARRCFQYEETRLGLGDPHLLDWVGVPPCATEARGPSFPAAKSVTQWTAAGRKQVANANVR